MSTTTANQIPTELSAQCSWVEIRYPDVEELNESEWVRIGEILERVTSRDPETCLASVIQSIRDRESQLWCLVDPDEDLIGVLVTKVLEFDTGYSSLLIHLAALDVGTRIELACWREVILHIEGVARMLGCDSVRIYGRKGWGAVLPNYTETHRVFEMCLQEKH